MRIIIQYAIKFNKGDHKGKEKLIPMDLEEVELLGLDMCLISEGWLESTSNDNEYEVMERSLIIN